MSARISAFKVGSSCGLRRTERSSGDCSTAAAKSASASWTSARRPASFARAEQRVGVDAVRDGQLSRLLEPREVERPDRLGDQLAVAVGIERAADDA